MKGPRHVSGALPYRHSSLATGLVIPLSPQTPAPRTVSSRRASLAVPGARAALREECSMPGQEQPAARARVAGSALPDGPAAPGSSGAPPSRSLAARTNRPAVPALIATLAAVAFTLARWQIWANG